MKPKMMRQVLSSKILAVAYGVTWTVRDSYIVNPDFDGLRAAELADDSMTNWCHHVQYILPQVLH